jgi:HK97 family phage major capsid protein
MEENKDVCLSRSARAEAGTLNEEQREISVVFGTEHPVRRYDWEKQRFFMEVLSFNPDHVNMERMENGSAPVLDNHDSWRGTSGALGIVERAELKGDHGVATLRFAKTPDVDNVWSKVQDGILRSVSVGYRVNEYSVDGLHENGLHIYRATDWEPIEVSIAPMPADPKSQAVRSATVRYEAPKVINEEKPKRDAEVVNNKKGTVMVQNVNDLKASRKALEDEMATLHALTERDETQEARYTDLVGKIDDVTKKIETKEAADRQLAARAAAGEGASKSEEQEQKQMIKRFSFSEAAKDVLGRNGVQGVAREMREHAQAKGHMGAGDIVIPGDFKRAGSADDFQAASGDGSGYVATEVGSFIEGLTAPLMIESWGTQIFTNQTANLKFPRESVKATATNEGEVDAGAASGAELDELTLSPNRYHNDTKYSKQLLLQGGASVEKDIAGILRRGHERKLLADIFTGAAGITGITGISGVNDIAAADGADYKAIATALITAVLEDHGLNDNCRFVLSPSAYEYMSNAAAIAGVSALLNEQARTIKTYDYHATPYLADASSGVGQIVFGDWTNAVLAYFGGIDIVIDPYSAKDTAQVEITMNRWVDFDLRQPYGFAFENAVSVS